MPFSAVSLVEFLDVGPGGWVVQTASNGAAGKIVAVRCGQQPTTRDQQRTRHLQAAHRQGLWGAKVSRNTSAEDRSRLFGELIGLLLDGSLPLASGGTYDLDRPTGAVAASQTPGRTGKTMFRPCPHRLFRH